MAEIAAWRAYEHGLMRHVIHLQPAKLTLQTWETLLALLASKDGCLETSAAGVRPTRIA